MSTIKVSPSKVGELFLKFVRKVRSQVCGIGEGFKWRGVELEIDYDPQDPANRERFFLDGWNQMSGVWPSIESDGNYTATNASIIEMISEQGFPQNRKLKILSVGAGPGLYEIFLASLFKQNGVPARVFSTDYSPKMIELQNKVLDSNISIDGIKVSSLRGLVLPMVSDMSEMSNVQSDSIDILLCNNSLQWVTDWKKAIVEMGRVMRPDGNKLALFFIHPHAMSVCASGFDMNREHITLNSLMDVLHDSGFSPTKTRMMIGGAGSGQDGRALNRMMVKTKYYPQGVETHWRDLVITSAGMSPFKTPT